MALQSSEGILESSFLIDFDDRPINAMYGKTDRSIPGENSDDGQNVTRSVLLSDIAAIILIHIYICHWLRDFIGNWLRDLADARKSIRMQMVLLSKFV